jgi:hypothetical protein
MRWSLRQAGVLFLIASITNIAHASIKWEREYPRVSPVYGEYLVTPMDFMNLRLHKRFDVFNITPNDYFPVVFGCTLNIFGRDTSTSLKTPSGRVNGSFCHFAKRVRGEKIECCRSIRPEKPGGIPSPKGEGARSAVILPFGSKESAIDILPGGIWRAGAGHRYLQTQSGSQLSGSKDRLVFHLIQGELHNTPLPVRITTTDDNGNGTNTGGNPQTESGKFIPSSVAIFSGALLIAGAVKCLFYAIDRGGKVFYMAFFGGFPIFFVGFTLVFFCFLSDPPTIFGLTVRGLWHVSTP